MVRVFAELRAQGERFSPSEAERSAGVTFSTKSEPGELGTMGHYAGKPKPYGSAELLMSVEAEAAASARSHLLDADWLKRVASMVPHCRSAGATSILVHIDVSHCHLADGQKSVGVAGSNPVSPDHLKLPELLRNPRLRSFVFAGVRDSMALGRPGQSAW